VFPHHNLRIDPMGAWTVPTAKRVVDELDGILEYLEDPCRGMGAMAELSRIVDVPLATNLVVVEMEQVFEAITKDAVQIILGDHHYWCGATGAVRLSDLCRASNRGRPKFVDGKLRVPEGPGLGVELDYEALQDLNDLYEQAMVSDRNDTDEMLKYVPDYVRKVPRW